MFDISSMIVIILVCVFHVIQTVSLMFDISSIIMVFNVCGFKVKYCHTESAKPDYNQLKILQFNWHSQDNRILTNNFLIQPALRQTYISD